MFSCHKIMCNVIPCLILQQLSFLIKETSWSDLICHHRITCQLDCVVVVGSPIKCIGFLQVSEAGSANNIQVSYNILLNNYDILLIKILNLQGHGFWIGVGVVAILLVIVSVGIAVRIMIKRSRLATVGCQYHHGGFSPKQNDYESVIKIIITLSKV